MENLRFDFPEFWRVTVTWDLERIGFFMRLLQAVWAQQQHLPSDVEAVAAMARGLGLNPRIVRKHYDDEMRGAIKRLVRQRIRISAATRVAIFERSQGVCWHCAERIEIGSFHVDHLEPVDAGGMSSLANLVASCAPCNLAKGARST